MANPDPPVPAALDALLQEWRSDAAWYRQHHPNLIDRDGFTEPHQLIEEHIRQVEAALRAAGPRTTDQKQVTLGVDWGRGESWTVDAAGSLTMGGRKLPTPPPAGAVKPDPPPAPPAKKTECIEALIESGAISRSRVDGTLWCTDCHQLACQMCGNCNCDAYYCEHQKDPIAEP